MLRSAITRRLPPLFAAAMRTLLTREGYTRADSKYPKEIARYTKGSSVMAELEDNLLDDNVVFIFLTPKSDPQLVATIEKVFPRKL